jgi:lambda family phage portal protein
MRAFVDLIGANVIGPDGVDLENEWKSPRGRDLEKENDLVEAAWDDWGRRVTADGRLSWLDFQHLAAESLAIDGEVFVHLLRGRGPPGLELDLIVPDRVDHTINTPLQGGRRVVMGVEVDPAFRPLAYHVRTAHPHDAQGMPRLVRVPAEEIIHVFLDERVNGVRGLPWATACMVQLNMLGRLWTSTLATANAEADRIGIIKGAGGLSMDDQLTLARLEDGEGAEADGQSTAGVAKELSSEMVTFMGLPPGMDVDFPPPQHPNAVLADFTKFLLKGIAAGLRVSYHTLSGDVAEANYSSLRASLLPEKDAWKKRQASIISQLHGPIFAAWTQTAWLTGAIDLAEPPSVFARPIFWPRSWEWVDPLKDITADIQALDNLLTTYQETLGKRGLDWRETFRQIKAEQDYAGELGLSIPRIAKILAKTAPQLQGAQNAKPE